MKMFKSSKSNQLLPRYVFLQIKSIHQPHDHQGSLYKAWINNYIHNKVWSEITYPFPNLNGAIEIYEWMSNLIS